MRQLKELWNVLPFLFDKNFFFVHRDFVCFRTGHETCPTVLCVQVQ